MSKIYTSATQLIGHTPLLKVTNYSKDQNIEGVELLAKLEDRKSTRLNSSHPTTSRMPSSA